MKLAVIPARGGSKRIPRKNIRKFFGRPMIVWSILAARSSGCFSRIIVSTDDEEIGEIARAAGCEVPFVRPSELSDAFTGTVPVIAHAVEWARDNGIEADQVCCIYATAPFVGPEDIRQGARILTSERCDYVFPVASYPFPIQRAIRITNEGRSEMFSPQHYTARSQDLERAYHDAGQFYWGSRSAWLERKAIFSSNSVPMIIPRSRVQDIDTEEDWRYAELMFEALNRQANIKQVQDE